MRHNTLTNVTTTFGITNRDAVKRKETIEMTDHSFISLPGFTLLITESENNDTAVRRYAGTEQDIVFHRLEYVRCDERFDELKALQRKARGSAAAYGEKITMAVDMSEWIGHENEDLFTITAKFLCDMNGQWSYVFTVGSHTRDEALGLFGVLMKYMSGRIVYDDTFTSTEALAGYIEENSTDSDAAALLAGMLMQDEMKELRTYPSVKRICREMLLSSDKDKITLEEVSAYLVCEDSLPGFIDMKLSQEYAYKARSFIRYESEENTVA
ncbi:MAG: hypothetical protein IK093_14320 [Ruminiclostridium sp.]|nr:hypothetical protein [Ruminiclostridium sp.]